MYTLNHESPDNLTGYDIFIGNDVLPKLADFINSHPFSKIFIIADEIVKNLYGEELLQVCLSTGKETSIKSIPNVGRQIKNIHLCINIYDWLYENNADRNSLLIVFGGGVIGDVGGYVASTFMRGLPHIMIPTTLLSQVDSSIGGKVGFNHNGVINLIGAYYNPLLVLINIKYLNTLSDTDFLSGYGELVKTLLIADKLTVSKLMVETPGSIRNNLLDLIFQCCRIKSTIVMSDPKEQNRKRWVLNYGHTIGQAIEVTSQYNYSHGESVSLGMVAASYVGEILGVTDNRVTQLQVELLRKFSLPVNLSLNYFQEKSPQKIREEILAATKRDKKSQNNKPNFIILKDVGDPILARAVELDTIKTAIDRLSANL